MRINKPLLASSLLLSLTTLTAEASLTSYTGNDGAGLVYSSISDITWTQDASLLRTLENTLGYDNAIAAIIAARPVIYDTPNYDDGYTGQHTVTASDFYRYGFYEGAATWFGAQAFVGYLNSVNYGGSDQWRLPTSDGNEFGQLFYSELGGTSGSMTPNTSTFNNEQAYLYWTGTEYAVVPSYAWFFDARNGYQNAAIKTFSQWSPPQNSALFAWAVSPGQVAAVPVPSAVWLMVSGLLGLVSLKRRGHAL